MEIPLQLQFRNLEPDQRIEEDIYFHRNSVAGDQYDRLEIGTRVRFEETMGRDGPQATTVQILGKPGATPAGDDEPPERAEPPRDWQA
jgi:cold shock CspA family protein